MTRAMLVCRLSKAKNTQLLTVSTETVRMANSRPRTDQSERSDLPWHMIKVHISRRTEFVNLMLAQSGDC